MRAAVGRAQCLAQREMSEGKSRQLPGGGHCALRSRNQRPIRERGRGTEQHLQPAQSLAVRRSHVPDPSNNLLKSELQPSPFYR